MSPKDTYPQHIVTAVIVAHDGAAWLPHVIRAVLDQSRPVQRVVAVDTGSRDRSGSVLADQLGSGVVFGMDRGTGYGAAVRRALQHRAANVSIPGPGQRIEWLWLLHDDSEPAPDALEQLLRGAAETRAAAVLGPKIRAWSDRRVILEAGVTIDTAGRRITGIEPREVDQGQHDGDRDVLAVGSAGMLVRRDVWDSVGAFDAGMALFRDDVDFCWRVHAAGHRVRLITDAVVYHAEAANRRKRALSVTRRPARLDRRNAMLTLAGNLPAGPMLAAMTDNLAVSMLRVLYFLVAKRVPAALDEMTAVASVFLHPFRLLTLRRRRARGRRAAYARLRRDLPPGHSLRRMAELVAARTRSKRDAIGEHHAIDDPENADFLLSDTGLAQRILTSPAFLLFIALTVVSLIAERSLLGPGSLTGGALIPAWGGASGLWHEYLQGFHPVGVGSGSSAPPYLAIIATIATVFGGKPWLAVDVILLGCVPLAGLSAFFAVRRVTQSVPVRLWAAASYALLPVGTGAIAAGRLGSAVVFVVAPVIALLSGRMLTLPPRQARRAAWATALVVAAAAAFVPLVWLVVLVAAVALAVARPALLRNLAIVAIVPPLLLLPWSAQLATNPSELLLEAGLQQPGLTARDLPARSLLLLSPGGPGLPPVWITAGIIVAALAGLLVTRRRALVMAGWGIALAGLLAAVAVSRTVISPAGYGQAVRAWPGVALLIPAVGLLLAGVSAGDTAQRLLASRRARRGSGAEAGPRAGRGDRSPLRRMAAAVLATAAFSAPVLAAAFWVATGIHGPVTRAAGPVVPPVVGASAASDLQLRTLVLRSAGGQVSYTVQRGDSPVIGNADLVPAPAAQSALATAVAELVAPNGGEAVNQGQLLAQLDIGFVLVPAPVNQGLAGQIDSVEGLRPVSATSAFYLWRLQDLTAEAVVLEPSGAVVTVPAGQAGISGAAAPRTGGTLELAEPAGGWQATLSGQPLNSVASPEGGWAQAFRLPSGGGVLNVSHPQTARDLILILEFLAVAAVVVLALPGARPVGEEGAQAAITSRPAGGHRAATPAAHGAGGSAQAGRGVRAAARAGLASRGHRQDRDASPGLRRARGAPQNAGRDQRAAPDTRQDAGAAATAARSAAGPGMAPDIDAEPTAAWTADAAASGAWELDPASTGSMGSRDMQAPSSWDTGAGVSGQWDMDAAAMDAQDVGAAGTGAWDVGPAPRPHSRPDATPRRRRAPAGGQRPDNGPEAGGVWGGRPPEANTARRAQGGRPQEAGHTGSRWRLRGRRPEPDTAAQGPRSRPPQAGNAGGGRRGGPPRQDSYGGGRSARSPGEDTYGGGRRGRPSEAGTGSGGRRGGPPGEDTYGGGWGRPPEADTGGGVWRGRPPEADTAGGDWGRPPAAGTAGRRPRGAPSPTGATPPPAGSGPGGPPGSHGARPGRQIPDRPAAPPGRGRRQPSGWTPPAYDEQWPDDQDQRWQSGPEGGWPSGQAPSGWPGGGSDLLAPLPPPPGRHGRRPEPPDDDDGAPPSARWPVPDYDTGGDQW